ncbi:protein kinase domain-containing protein [Dokdonella sp. MW10]|uniref:serine/threonine-protein kinase n=1 Tax=Dokdonella sp. MW10 TaxID=2992926 RepID=UPI003F817F1A
MTTPPSLRELFDAVVDLDPTARRRHLDACCPPGLRAELEAMLAADAEAHDGPTSSRIGELAAGLSDDVPVLPPTAGTRIGPFEVLGLLGEGGYSTVLHAARDVGGARQEVALKLLSRSLHSPEAQRQFRREQQALLALRHPNIARLIEGGVTDTGQPYIALELVQGRDIVEHASAHALDLRARLRLFVVACRAVDAAHRALIVHRDLKPSNVFVADDGEVKLLDFGIAKLLEADEDVTHTMLPAFTPAYAAPEQRDGGAITTATDVYALGVLLGELLTGERVNDGTGRTPSSRISATGGDGSPTPVTRRQLRGDLDTIVMKALAEEPERRYASAGTFADDIERLLAGQPVVAHPPSRWYRTRKFVSRHKGGVITTAALLLAVFASLGAALWQAGVAQREAARARAENRFIAGLFSPLRTGVQEGEMPTVRQLLDAGVAQLNTEFADDDAAIADLATLFSRVHIEIGAKDVALDLATRAYDHARAAWGERDARTWMALARRGEAAYFLDRFGDAVADLERATAGMRAARSLDDSYAFALSYLGLAYSKTGRAPEAVDALLKAHAMLEASGRDEVATVMNHLGGAYMADGDAGRSLEWRQRAYDWHVARGAGENRSALTVLGNIARVKYGMGRWREAGADLDRLIPLRDKVVGGSLGTWSFSTQACSVAFWRWQLDKAQAWCDRAMAEAEREAGSVRPRAIVLGFRASLRARQGDYAQARADQAESRRLLSTIEGNYKDALQSMGVDESEMVRIEGTPSAFIDVSASLLPAPDDEAKSVAGSTLLLARFALACAQVETAPEACGNDAAVRAERLLTQLRAEHPYRLPAITALVLRALHLGATPDAVERMQTAIDASRAELDDDHPWIAEAQSALATAADANGDDALAREARAESLRIAQRLPPSHPLRAYLTRSG